MIIEIIEGKPKRKDISTPKKVGEGNYLIVYHKDLDGLPWLFAIYQDLLWCLVDQGLPMIDDLRRKRFLGANVNSFKRFYRKYWEGK